MNFNFNGNYPNRKTKRKTMKIETRECIFKKLWYNIKSCNLIKVGTLEGDRTGLKKYLKKYGQSFSITRGVTLTELEVFIICVSSRCLERQVSHPVVWRGNPA